MNQLINFTNCEKLKKGYGGANGQKISIKYEGEQYMLKFPSYAKRNKDMSYANSCLSEYLGCHIFECIGIPVQETLLGVYQVNGQERLVVACKDLTKPGIVIQDFASLKNRIIDSERNGYGTELSDIQQTIEDQDIIFADLLNEHFWDMFIIDALIGNWDRHNGNWGFLYNQFDDTMNISPVYDCGSGLFPQADEKLMKEMLDEHAELNARVFERPLSAITINGKKINYHKFISSLDNDNCNKALERIVPRINMIKIGNIIDEIPGLTKLQNSFYKTVITNRMVKIIAIPYLQHIKNIPEKAKEAKNALKELSSYIKTTFDKNFIEREFGNALNMFDNFYIDQSYNEIISIFKETYNIPNQIELRIENGCIVTDIAIIENDDELAQNVNKNIIQYTLQLLRINKDNPFEMQAGVNIRNMNLLQLTLELPETEIFDPDFDPADILE